MRAPIALLSVLLVLLLSTSACSSAPVEEESPTPPPDEVSAQELEQAIKVYVGVCQALCDQNETCIDDRSVYSARHCRQECEANLELATMDIDDRGGLKKCFNHTATYSQCVTALSCEDWQLWQDNFGTAGDDDYPCGQATQRAHRACHPFMEELDAAQDGGQ